MVGRLQFGRLEVEFVCRRHFVFRAHGLVGEAGIRLLRRARVHGWRPPGVMVDDYGTCISSDDVHAGRGQSMSGISHMPAYLMVEWTTRHRSPLRLRVAIPRSTHHT